MVVHDLDHEREEAVEQGDDLGRVALGGQPRRALEINEQDRRLTGFPAELHPVLERVAHDVLPDLAPEQVTELLALAQPGQHPVKAGLEQPDLAAVIHRHVVVEVPLLDPRHRGAQGLDRVGQRVGQADHEGQADDQPDRVRARSRPPRAEPRSKFPNASALIPASTSPNSTTPAPSVQDSTVRAATPGSCGRSG